jgi:hypothetical protein
MVMLMVVPRDCSRLGKGGHMGIAEPSTKITHSASRIAT